jgi:hypothetical protein
MNVLLRALNGALNRVRRKGLIETLHYSALVAPNRLKDAYVDLRYGRKLAGYRDLKHLGLPDVTGIAPTPTHVLEDVFALEPIKPDDVLWMSAAAMAASSRGGCRRACKTGSSGWSWTQQQR